MCRVRTLLRQGDVRAPLPAEFPVPAAPRDDRDEAATRAGRPPEGMRVRPPEPRSPLSVGFAWSSRIMALGLEVALPALGGLYLDRHLGSSPVGTLVGATLGFAAMMLHLLQIAHGGSKAAGGGPPGSPRGD